MNYQLNQYLMYPGLGIGRIVAFETKEVFSAKVPMITLKFESGTIVLVPVEGIEAIGIRPLCNRYEALEALKIVRGPKPSHKRVDTWESLIETLQGLKSGRVLEVAQALLELEVCEPYSVPFPEANLIETTKIQFYEELELVLGGSPGWVEVACVDLTQS
jgi:RNA polymerase-interacting CarD/CdnL/TRCF family regulator